VNAPVLEKEVPVQLLSLLLNCVLHNCDTGM